MPLNERTARLTYVMTAFVLMCIFTMFGYFYHFHYRLAATHEQGYQSSLNMHISDEILLSRDVRSDEGKIRAKILIAYHEHRRNLLKLGKVRGKKRLPDLIGIGFKKCGTGGIGRMLRQHAMVKQSEPPELHFFENPAKYRKGVESYINMFPEVLDFETLMEKTPSYVVKGDFLPHRMLFTAPKAKLFVVLCDPVNRTFSDFVHETYTGRISSDTNYDSFVTQYIAVLSNKFARCHSEEEVENYILDHGEKDFYSTIVSTGIYYHHLRRWLQVYNRSQIMIIDGERLLTEPWNVINELQEFLGLPRLIIKEDYVKDPATGFYCVAKPKVFKTDEGTTVRHTEPRCIDPQKKGRTRLSSWSYQPSHATIKLVRQFYKPYNEKLFKMLGERFAWQ